jgi:hypothetical protein
MHLACKLDAMRRSLIVVCLALAAPWSLSAQNAESSTRGFKWLDPIKDVTLFQQIKAAFSEELKPDDPEKVKPVVAQLYKKISRIGIYQSSALVLILERETPTSPYGDYFQPFNYDLKNGKKEAFEGGFYLWRFNKFARFEASAVPDVVFTYWSCTECEGEHLLGSFHFDPAAGEWEVRRWGDKDNDDAIIIGDDGKVFSEEDDTNYDCLYKFGDFTGDGFDDIAVRCLAIDQSNRIVNDTTTIYAAQHGRPQVIAVKDPSQLGAIREKLCTDIKKSKLCPSK